MPLSCSAIPNTLKPPHIFLTSTITFHIANKVSLSMTVDKAATLWRPWSLSCDMEILHCVQHGTDHSISGIWTLDMQCPLPFWTTTFKYGTNYTCSSSCIITRAGWMPCKPYVHIHPLTITHMDSMTLLSPVLALNMDGLRKALKVQSLCCYRGWYYTKTLMIGHFIVQLRFIFCLINANYFVTYIQHFNASNVHLGTTSMHSLKWAIKPNGAQIGNVVPVLHLLV